jgi:hypothetical protein
MGVLGVLSGGLVGEGGGEEGVEGGGAVIEGGGEADPGAWAWLIGEFDEGEVGVFGEGILREVGLEGEEGLFGEAGGGAGVGEAVVCARSLGEGDG